MKIQMILYLIDMLVSNFDLKPLFRNQENINFVKDAMFAATNEAGGTSFRSRYNDKKFMFAGKTGSSQVKRFTELQRELEIKQKDIVYKDRDHAYLLLLLLTLIQNMQLVLWLNMEAPEAVRRLLLQKSN